MYDSIDGADAFTLMTEWRQFCMPSLNVIQKVMKGRFMIARSLKKKNFYLYEFVKLYKKLNG